jgi:F-type H+-transporting ATPase subunit epsilon
MAIPKHLQLLFVTPDRALAQEDVDEVELPGEEGYFGVLPGHAPLLAALRTGEMWYRKGAQKHYAFIDGGFAEVLPDRVSIMAQVAERAEDIDLARAEASKRRAEDLLARPAAAEDVESTRSALQRAVMRLDVSRHGRARH